jgi:muconolactone delta-isomerase
MTERETSATFMVMARFKPDTNMGDVFAVVAEEQAQVASLAAQGRMGAIHLSMPRQTVFLEVFAADEAEAVATVESLPMARWWTLDVYPATPPVAPGPAS